MPRPCSKRRNHRPVGVLAILPPHRSSRVDGFTLVELLLSTLLLMLLISAVALNFSALRRGSELDEGGARLETLLQLARAHAANTGRKVEVYFERGEESDFLAPALGSIRIAWEPEPLDAPGVMIDLNEPGWNLEELNELIAVAAAGPLGSALASASKPTPSEGQLGAGEPDPLEWLAMEEPDMGMLESAMGTAESWKPIQFYPDGSCDSAEIMLVSRDREDTRRVLVEIVGMTGQVRRRPLAAELEEPGLDVTGESAEEPLELSKE